MNNTSVPWDHIVSNEYVDIIAIIDTLGMPSFDSGLDVDTVGNEAKFRLSNIFREVYMLYSCRLLQNSWGRLKSRFSQAASWILARVVKLQVFELSYRVTMLKKSNCANFTFGSSYRVTMLRKSVGSRGT